MEIQKRNNKQNENRPSFRRGPGFMPLRQAMDRLLNESFLDPFRVIDEQKSVGYPKVDISESDSDIKVKADLPGIDPDDVKIEVDENSLTIQGETETSTEEKDEDRKFYRKERSYGKFKRSFRLPSKIDVGEVTAQAEEGTISITLPKAERDSKKTVKVES